MNKLLILIVEDDTSVRNLITTTLKAHDYRYLTAPNGQTAILEASSHNPDIVLLDLGLPDIDGVEVIEKIRTWSNMPIIVISARSEDTDKIDALDAGADDYLTKPFSVEELLARLRVMQRRLTMIQRPYIFPISVILIRKKPVAVFKAIRNNMLTEIAALLLSHLNESFFKDFPAEYIYTH